MLNVEKTSSCMVERMMKNHLNVNGNWKNTSCIAKGIAFFFRGKMFFEKLFLVRNQLIEHKVLYLHFSYRQHSF